jgi:hypothetical protein
MNTTKNEANMTTENEKSLSSNQGRGRGLNSMADAIASAAVPALPESNTTWGDSRAMTAATLLDAWFAGEELAPLARALANGIADLQAIDDITMSTRFAKTLRNRMQNDGREVTDTMEREARAAALCAITQFRNGVIESAAVTSNRVMEGVAVVAWRAVVKEMSADHFGHTIEFSTVSDSWLMENICELAIECVAGLETRNERASRWLAERGRGQRHNQLTARIDALKVGAGARRKALLERIETAARLILLESLSIEQAAERVGFRGHGRTSAGERLAASARRCGLKFEIGQPRRSQADDWFNPHNRQTAFPVRELSLGQLWADHLTVSVLPDGSIEWN